MAAPGDDNSKQVLIYTVIVGCFLFGVSLVCKSIKHVLPPKIQEKTQQLVDQDQDQSQSTPATNQIPNLNEQKDVGQDSIINNAYNKIQSSAESLCNNDPDCSFLVKRFEFCNFLDQGAILSLDKAVLPIFLPSVSSYLYSRKPSADQLIHEANQTFNENWDPISKQPLSFPTHFGQEAPPPQV